MTHEPRIGCFIPIKARSTRVKGKNFRGFRGRPLYQWIIDHAIKAAVFRDVVVDTDSSEISDWAVGRGAIAIERDPKLATDAANGNDLIKHHGELFGFEATFDYYFQLFATAPNLKPSTIRQAVTAMIELPAPYDSILTTRIERGWFWNTSRQPVNFRPSILPRSQDADYLIKETTGLYGITAAALKKYSTRTGACPFFFQIPEDEAIDLDTDEDFRRAGEVPVATMVPGTAGGAPARMAHGGSVSVPPTPDHPPETTPVYSQER
jgi:N-acylneuraminate cytidylyltransferase